MDSQLSNNEESIDASVVGEAGNGEVEPSDNNENSNELSPIPTPREIREQQHRASPAGCISPTNNVSGTTSTNQGNCKILIL